MKVKLLKKVRKRFEIIHIPNGFRSSGIRYEYNLFRLIDSTNQFYERFSQLGHKEGQQFTEEHQIFETEKECIDYLKSLIVSRLRSEGYLGRRDKKMKLAEKKVWYV